MSFNIAVFRPCLFLRRHSTFKKFGMRITIQTSFQTELISDNQGFYIEDSLQVQRSFWKVNYRLNTKLFDMPRLFSCNDLTIILHTTISFRVFTVHHCSDQLIHNSFHSCLYGSISLYFSSENGQTLAMDD